MGDVLGIQYELLPYLKIFYIESMMLLKILAFKWTIRKILNKLAVHIEGISHMLMSVSL
jgi:hypothetical protein